MFGMHNNNQQLFASRQERAKMHLREVELYDVPFICKKNTSDELMLKNRKINFCPHTPENVVMQFLIACAVKTKK